MNKQFCFVFASFLFCKVCAEPLAIRVTSSVNSDIIINSEKPILLIAIMKNVADPKQQIIAACFPLIAMKDRATSYDKNLLPSTWMVVHIKNFKNYHIERNATIRLLRKHEIIPLKGERWLIEEDLKTK